MNLGEDNIFMKNNYQILNELNPRDQKKSSPPKQKKHKTPIKEETLDDYIEKILGKEGADAKYLTKAKSALYNMEAEVTQKYREAKNQMRRQLKDKL